MCACQVSVRDGNKCACHVSGCAWSCMSQVNGCVSKCMCVHQVGACVGNCVSSFKRDREGYTGSGRIVAGEGVCDVGVWRF